MKQLLLHLIWLLALTLPAWSANSDTDFGGVGIDGIPFKNGQIAVRQIIIGSPAHKCGIRTGDIITHIDGKLTMGSNFQDMVKKRLRGLSGTVVILKIKRDGEEKLLTYKLIRQQLKISPNKEHI